MSNSDTASFNYCYHCMELMPEGTLICPHCGHDNSRKQNPEDLMPEGSILSGKYLVGCVLGRGGFGVTYLGIDLNLYVKVAIKEYFPVGVGVRGKSGRVRTASDLKNSQGFEDGLEKFLDEARTLALFKSPHVVFVREFFKENGTAYIVMDYVDGIGFDQEIKRNGYLPWQRVLSLMKPLIAELGKIHDKGLIHRDIKPANIRLTKDENSGKEWLVLLDFGSARRFVKENVSMDYTAFITPGYAPFEQYMQRGVQGPFTDVYAICATMYAAITGQLPPTAPDRVEGAELPSFKSFHLDVPADVEKAIFHGMEMKSSDRPGTMKDLYDELNGIRPETEKQEDFIYKDAKKSMAAGDREGYRKALEYFGRIPGWKDADQLAEQCRKKLSDVPVPPKPVKWWIYAAAVFVFGIAAFFAVRGMQGGDDAKKAYSGTTSGGVSTVVYASDTPVLPTETAVISTSTDVPVMLIDTETSEPTSAPAYKTAAATTPVPTQKPTATPRPTSTPTKKPAPTATPRPTSTPTKKPTATAVRSLQVGDVITFGSYEQDNNTSNGKERIRWSVLDVQGNKALLLSTLILDARQFHNRAEIGGGWASSKLRSWLMNDFYNTAFSSAEKRAVLTTAQRATSKDTSDDYDTVFILSTEQVKKYLPSGKSRQFNATTYAIKSRKVFKGADGYYNWWTRSNHIEEGSFWKDQIDIVRKFGEIAYTKPTDEDCGILPAVWIDITVYRNL